MQPLDATALPGTVTQHLSVFELFLQSDSIVKLVLLLLLAASFWSWAIIFDKSLRIRRLQHAAGRRHQVGERFRPLARPSRSFRLGIQREPVAAAPREALRTASAVYSGGVRASGRSGRGRHRPMSDINATPLVDVMQVLLV